MMETLTVKIPSWVNKENAEDEFLKSLKLKAQLKMEYYKSRMLPFEAKYKCSILEFKIKLESEPSEDFEKWDALIEWQAFYDAFTEWKKRIEEFVKK